MTAGEALRRENIAGYNCSYVAVDRVAAFDEILYVLMKRINFLRVKEEPMILTQINYDIKLVKLIKTGKSSLVKTDLNPTNHYTQ